MLKQNDVVIRLRLRRVEQIITVYGISAALTFLGWRDKTNFLKKEKEETESSGRAWPLPRSYKKIFQSLTTLLKKYFLGLSRSRTLYGCESSKFTPMIIER